jgi:hypothetical protein
MVRCWQRLSIAKWIFIDTTGASFLNSRAVTMQVTFVSSPRRS